MPRWLYPLLLAVPVALLGRVAGWPPVVVFVAAIIGVIPLAGLIGFTTETLAEHVGQRLGGLLTATFGNAAELIIGATALAAGLTDVVRASITGSIIGNALFALGCAMLVGGWRHGVQRFDARNAGQYATLLALAVVGLALPSLVATVGGGATTGQHVVSGVGLHELSMVIAGILLASYIAYIAYSVFGLRAGAPRRRSFNQQVVSVAADEEERATPTGARAPGDATRRSHAQRQRAGQRPAAVSNEPRTRWAASPWPATLVLAIATIFTALVSEALVGALEPVAASVGFSPIFIGLIVLPLAGNAAEFSSALRAAMNSHMETTMAITAGASIQIALLVAPALVIAGALLGHPLDLDFSRLELVVFGLISLIFALVSLDGESTWLEGAQLLAFYLIVAVVAFFIPR